jgi:hypothetical protein
MLANKKGILSLFPSVVRATLSLSVFVDTKVGQGAREDNPFSPKNSSFKRVSYWNFNYLYSNNNFCKKLKFNTLCKN